MGRWQEREFGYVRKPPNSFSDQRTPTTILFDTHYAQLRLVERWTWERFARLSSFLTMTPAELASMAGMSHGLLESWKRSNMLPGHGRLPQAIILTLLEARVLDQWSTDIIPNPFPNFSSLAGLPKPKKRHPDPFWLYKKKKKEAQPT